MAKNLNSNLYTLNSSPASWQKPSGSSSLKIVLLSLTVISCLIIGSMLIYASVQHQKITVQRGILAEKEAAAKEVAPELPTLGPAGAPAPPSAGGATPQALPLPRPPGLTIAGSSEPSDDSEWPMFNRYLNHTGYNSEAGPMTNNTLWTFTAGGNVYSPTVVGGIVYVGSGTPDNHVYALNKTNGNQIWNYTATASVYTAPAVADGIVYFGDVNGKIFAVNASNGNHVWNYSAGMITYSSPAVANGVVYIGSRNDKNIYALNATNGSQIWNYTLTTSANGVESSPAVVNGVVYIGAMDYLYALNATNGNYIWNATITFDVISAPVVVGDIVYVGSNFKRLRAVNATNGSIIWSFLTEGNGNVYSPAFANGIVYFGSTDKNVYALNATNGSKIWSYTTGNYIYYSSPVVAGDVVYAGSYDNNVYALNATNGSLIWIYTTGGHVAYNTPAIVNGVMYVGSADHKLYAFGPPTDLTPTEIEYSPHGPQDGQTVTINVTVKNSGDKYNDKAFNVSLYVDDVYQTQGRFTSALNPNETGVISLTWTADSGLHRIKAVVDSAGEISEPDETNNNLTQMIGVDWPMFHQTVEHYGLANTNGPLTNNTAWIYTTGGSIHSSPAVADGIVYVGSGMPDNRVYALNANNGIQIWNYTTGSTVFSSLAVADGIVYVDSSDDKNVYALNATDGSYIWNYTTGDVIGFSSPAVADGLVYVGSYDNKIHALNATNGSQIWSYTTGELIESSPAVAGGIVYIGSYDKNIYALNATNGSQIWSYATGDNIVSSPAIADGIVYVGSFDNVYALNATNGNSIWNYTTGDTVLSSPAVAGGIVYIGSYDKNIYALNATNGSQIWSYTTGELIESSPAVAGGIVYIGSGDGKLYAFGDLAVISGVNPTNGTAIGDSTPTITFATDVDSSCRASTTDESYDDMADNINCSGGGTTSHSCTMSDLGSDGSKNIYLACMTDYGAKHSASTNTDLTYTLDATAPVVTLSAPASGSSVQAPADVTFNYSVNDVTSGIANCSLYGTFGGSWGLNQTNTTAITESATENFTINNLGRGYYTWNVQCYDNVSTGGFANANWTYTVGYVVQNLSVTGVLEENEYINVSETPQALSKAVLLKDDAGKRIGTITINFDQATGDIDLSDVVADTNISARTAILYNPSWPSEVESSKTLYVPSTGIGSVYICESATNLNDVNESCPGYFTVTVGQTYFGITVSQLTVGGQSYYKAEGITGTGGGETENPVVPEFNLAGLLIAMFGGLCAVLIILFSNKEVKFGC